MNRYEQELLSNCSNLDAVTNAGGKITSCAQAIIDNKKEASKRLCRFIEKSTELKNPQITSIAIATKDSLIKFYGYSEVVNICSTKENDNEDDSHEELANDSEEDDTTSFAEQLKEQNSYQKQVNSFSELIENITQTTSPLSNELESTDNINDIDNSWDTLLNYNNFNEGTKVIEKGEPLFIRLDRDEEINYIKEGMKNG